MRLLRLVLAIPVGLAVVILALVVVLLGAPFWGVGLVARAVHPVFRPHPLRWPDLIAFDPELGWRPRPGLDALCLEERNDVFRVTTGPDGWHGRRSLHEARIVVLGDSHAFGYGVDASRSFAHVDPALGVKAIGAPGYNMVQELLILRDLAPRCAGKLLVWFVYPSNDLYDNLSPEMGGYRMPFVRQREDGSWEIVTRHLSPRPWRASTGRAGGRHLPTLAALHGDTALARRAFAACGWLLGQGAEVCRAAGVPLAVMLIPTPHVLSAAAFEELRRHGRSPETLRPDFPDLAIGGLCAELGVPFVSLRERLERRDFKEYDDHWTPSGHRKVAAVLAELARAHLAGAPALAAA